MVAIDIRLSVYGEYICPECYSGEFGYHSGNVFCRDCGLVVYNEEQPNQMYYENYMKDIENLKNHLEDRRVKNMMSKYHNGIINKVNRQYGSLSVGDKKRFDDIKALSIELRNNQFVLGQDKKIIRVKDGKATFVEDDFILGLIKDLDKFNTKMVSGFDVNVLKSELYYMPNIQIINKDIPTEPLTDPLKLRTKVIKHNKKCKKVFVTSSDDEQINSLIDHNFFISDNKLYRFDEFLSCYGELNKRNRIILYSGYDKIPIFVKPIHKEIIKDLLLNIPKSEVDLVLKEYERIKELEEKNKYLGFFPN